MIKQFIIFVANAAGTSNTDFTTVQSTAPARKQAKRRRGQKDSND